MGKKIIAVLLMVSMLLCGCGNSEENEPISDSEMIEISERAQEVSREANSIDGFENATLEYERFNSYASENGLDGTKIYVEGVAKEITRKDDKVIGFILEQKDGKVWGISYNDTIEGYEDIVNSVLREEIRVFGTYLGFSDEISSPCLMPLNDDGSGKIERKIGEDTYETIWDFFEYLSGTTQADKDTEQKESDDEPEYDDLTIGQKNALHSALSYLSYSSFSYQGLIKQLEYEKYTHEDAVFAADNCGADWNEQAVKQAASYLEYSSFSKDGLIEQLEYEGFTHEQAVYGVEQNGY